MKFGRRCGIVFVLVLFPLTFLVPSTAQSPASSPSARKVRAEHREVPLDSGTLSDGVYRNKSLGLSCKIPLGWVLRTEEMNAREDGEGDVIPSPSAQDPHFSQNRGEVGHPAGGRVLLATFSRPPEARGEDVNSSILIVAEDAAAYPGLKEAAQYFGPLTEVAKAQGFSVDEEPYEVAVGTKTLVRGDFHKDVGPRVMRQSTLAMLAHGYAVSITVIGGTGDEVEELIEGLDFAGSARGAKAPK